MDIMIALNACCYLASPPFVLAQHSLRSLDFDQSEDLKNREAMYVPAFGNTFDVSDYRFDETW